LPNGEERIKVTFLIWTWAHPCKTLVFARLYSLWKDLSRGWDGKCLETWHGLISIKRDLTVIATTYGCCKKNSQSNSEAGYFAQEKGKDPWWCRRHQ